MARGGRSRAWLRSASDRCGYALWELRCSWVEAAAGDEAAPRVVMSGGSVPGLPRRSGKHRSRPLESRGVRGLGETAEKRRVKVLCLAAACFCESLSASRHQLD